MLIRWCMLQVELGHWLVVDSAGSARQSTIEFVLFHQQEDAADFGDLTDQVEISIVQIKQEHYLLEVIQVQHRCN